MKGSMDSQYIWFQETSLGWIGIQSNVIALTNLYFGCHPVPVDVTERQTPLLREVFRVLRQYLQGEKVSFRGFPISLAKTDFQIRVLSYISLLPYGETRTYLQIAQDGNCPGAVRAIGSVCRGNPMPIIIPCHRVVGSGGKLGGYSGGIEMKRRLLALEGIQL